MEKIALPLRKQVLATLVSVALAATLCPAPALAADDDQQAVEPVVQADTPEDNGGTTESGTTTPPAPDNTTPGDNGGATTEPSAPTTPDPAPAKPDPAPTTQKPAPAAKVTVAFSTGAKLSGSKWQKVKAGKVAGKEVTTKSLTSVRIYNNCKNIKGAIKYKVYLSKKGWSGWKQDGKVAGNGKAKNAVQGLSVKLTGDLAKKYNVYYRVNLVGLGWTGWGKNGEQVGAPKVSTAKAYQIKIVKKSDKAGNKKYNTKAKRKNMKYTAKSGFEMTNQMAMAAKAQNQTSATSWLILVDTNKNRVAIFKGKKGAWQVKKYWKCTTGAPGSRTVRGKFTIKDRGKVFGSGYSCWYWTQFHGNYLFHSILYNPGSMSSVQDGRLGINASHGCVRLALGDAKWINKNIPRGTKVWSY